MKKVWNFILTVLGFVEKPAIDMAGDVFGDALDSFNESNPDLCKSMTQGFYAFIPHLEKAAKKTKTDLDDNIVAEAKQQVEDFAKEKQIGLPVID